MSPVRKAPPARRGALLPACLLLACLALPAPGLCAAPALQGGLEVATGYRTGDFRWNIAGDLNGANPNILSELTWSDLQIYLLEGRGEVVLFGFALDASVEYGWILAGSNQDSDYLGDDRTAEVSRSCNDASGGLVLDVSASLGYRFELQPDVVLLEPMAGLSYHHQGLVMTDGVQAIPARGPFQGLDSRYDAHWGSTWLGTELTLRFARWVSLRTRLAYHFAAYVATADWNLRDDFEHPVSFVHQGPAYGGELEIGLDFAFSRRWSMECALSLEQWGAVPGTDETYLDSGKVLQTRLNEVVWKSLRLTVGTAVRL